VPDPSTANPGGVKTSVEVRIVCRCLSATVPVLESVTFLSSAFQIGTGFSDQSLVDHAKFFKEHIIDKPKSYYRYVYFFSQP